MKENILITIESVPHYLQRYPTVGDFQEEIREDETAVYISVSKMSDWRYMVLVGVHELIEYSIVKHNKISLKKIDAFDIAYEKNRKKGDVSEPGDAKGCCYRVPHQFATKVEKLLAVVLGVNWKKYEKEVNSL
jgi:hypothetical protein